MIGRKSKKLPKKVVRRGGMLKSASVDMMLNSGAPSPNIEELRSALQDLDIGMAMKDEPNDYISLDM